MTSTTRLPKILRLAALVAALATLGVWLGTGAHRGWTRTSVTEMHRDEVTGLDFPVERAQFIAGLELLAAGLGVSAALGLGAFAAGRRRQLPE